MSLEDELTKIKAERDALLSALREVLAHVEKYDHLSHGTLTTTLHA